MSRLQDTIEAHLFCLVISITNARSSLWYCTVIRKGSSHTYTLTLARSPGSNTLRCTLLKPLCRIPRDAFLSSFLRFAFLLFVLQRASCPFNAATSAATISLSHFPSPPPPPPINHYHGF
ncbi:hypothetical protein FRC18_004769 [Serendipita sp. 400]|nr:hypothetical protein FRC18_004769 [Serendipita sp. 400]